MTAQSVIKDYETQIPMMTMIMIFDYTNEFIGSDVTASDVASVSQSLIVLWK